MVKVDASRDYYADLELPSDCSTDEVKKQFRKLALKYHPDRNPGKELEYNPRFQAIQAAHEVLGDPDQRSKYDVSRTRGNSNTSFNRPPPPRRNQYQPPTSNFPPPPRRTGPNAAPNSGAERYTNFPAPPPTRKEKPSSSQDARDRANMFSAWQHMNTAQKAQAQAPRNQGYTPSPGPSERPGRRPPSASDESTTRKPTPYEDLRRPQPDLRRSASGRAQRKAGFDPTTPSGDEGQAPGSRFPSGTTPVVPPRPQAPTARKPEMASQFRRSSGSEVPYVEAERVRTPYTAHPEEKTYFTAEAIRRSASTRDTTKLNRPEERPTMAQQSDRGGRRHSQSPPHKKATAGDNAGKSQSAGGPRTVEYSSSDASDESSSSSDEPSSTASNPPPRPKARPSPSWTKRNGMPPSAQSSPFPANQGGRTDSSAQKPPTIFTFPIEADTFTPSSIPDLKARSSEHVDTNFSPGGGPVPFSGNGATADELPRRGSLPNAMPFRGRVPSRSQQLSPDESILSPEEQPPPPRSSGDDAAPSIDSGVFSPDQWARKIQEDDWASRLASMTPPPPGTSPTRNAPNSRKTRGAGLRTASSGAPRTPVTLEEEEMGEYYAGLDAMDIDPTPPPHNREPPIPPPPPGPPPASATRTSPTFNMKNLSSVPPFQSSPPKDSYEPDPAPPPRPPARFERSAELPKVPRAPFPLAKLTQKAWATYLEQMTAYISAWNKFYAEMIELFQMRAVQQNELETGRIGDVGDGWLGPTRGSGGSSWESYVKSLEEDNKAREHLATACERHWLAVQRHGRLRETLARNGLQD